MKNKEKLPTRRVKPINILRGALGQKKSPKHLKAALANYKIKGPFETFEYAYAMSTTSNQFPAAYPAGRKVAHIGMLNYGTALKVASFSREVHWAAVSCYFSKLVLSKFIPLRVSFFEYLTQGQFAEAGAALDEIDASCGNSLWAIENRILLLSIDGGFEAQKKYVQELAVNNPRSNAAFFANYIGERNESRVTVASFKERVDARSKSWDITDEHLAEIKFRLLDKVGSDEGDFSAILARQGNNSSIDLYETLLVLLRRAKGRLNIDKSRTKASMDLLKTIADVRLVNLEKYLLEDYSNLENLTPDRAYVNEFLKGNYQAAFNASLERLNDKEFEVEACFYTARTSLIVGAEVGDLRWPRDVITSNFIHLLASTSRSEGGAEALQKIALNIRHSDFGAYILALLDAQTYHGMPRRNQLLLSSSLYLTSGNLRLRLESERNSLVSDEGLEYLYEKASAGLAKPDFEGSGISLESIAYARLYGSLAEGKTTEAVSYIQKLSKSKHALFRTEASYLFPNILAQDLQIEAAIIAAVDAYLEKPEILPFTPLMDLMRVRGFRELKQMKDSPYLSIAFYIYASEVESSEKEVALKVAWKHFLRLQNVASPSELTLDRSAPEFNALVFFLQHVCTQQTMELGGSFGSQLDLDRERMQICIQLVNIDPVNRDSYDAEILELTRRINIEEGVKFLESSRVYVDEVGINSWAKKNVEAEFLRYIDFMRAGLFKSIKELEESLVKIVSQSKNRQLAIQNYLDQYDLTAEGLLEEVLRELAQAFLSLPRYGLDAFLSSRIRHGSFVGYLRGPLEAKNLITKKDSNTAKYQDNDYLLSKWNIESREQQRQANVHLARFSAQIDTILDQMVARHLHVKSKLRPEGMIAFGTDSGSSEIAFKRWVIVLKSTLENRTTIGELVDFCLTNLFWPAIRISLEQIQNYLRGEFRSKLTEALDELVSALNNSMHESKRSHMLADAYSAKTDIQSSVDRVALWFDTQQVPNERIVMSLTNAIEVGLISTKNARPQFNPKVNWKIDADADVGLKPHSIRVINEISFLVFENASKHSGFEEVAGGPQQQQELEVSAQVVENGIRLRIVSEISEGKDIQDVADGIARAKKKIENREFDGVTQAIKGTGLVRLAINAGGQDTDGNDPVAGTSVDFGLLNSPPKFYVTVILGKAVYQGLTGED